MYPERNVRFCSPLTRITLCMEWWYCICNLCTISYIFRNLQKLSRTSCEIFWYIRTFFDILLFDSLRSKQLQQLQYCTCLTSTQISSYLVRNHGLFVYYLYLASSFSVGLDICRDDSWSLLCVGCRALGSRLVVVSTACVNVAPRDKRGAGRNHGSGRCRVQGRPCSGSQSADCRHALEGALFVVHLWLFVLFQVRARGRGTISDRGRRRLAGLDPMVCLVART